MLTDSDDKQAHSMHFAIVLSPIASTRFSKNHEFDTSKHQGETIEYSGS